MPKIEKRILHTISEKEHSLNLFLNSYQCEMNLKISVEAETKAEAIAKLEEDIDSMIHALTLAKQSLADTL